MNSSARLDDLAQKFQEDPRRYFAPLANEYRKSGQPSRAVELCREQLAEHRGHLSGHVVLALALHDLDARDEARQAYQDALQLDPENILVLRSLGDLARESGEPDLARDWYERAMGVDPRDPEVARRLAALEREQEQAPLSASDLSFTAALAAAELRHQDEAPDAGSLELVEQGEADEQVETIDPAEQVEQSEQVERAGDEPGGADEAAEFTAGFFATVLDEPASAQPVEPEHVADDFLLDGTIADDSPVDEPVAGGSPTGEIGIDEPFLAEPTPVGDDALGETIVTGDMDRLFADLEPITDDTLEAVEEPLAAELEPMGEEPAEPLGTELAIADGAAIVPDLPSMPELGELPPLEVFHDVQELEEVPAEESLLEMESVLEMESAPAIESSLDEIEMESVLEMEEAPESERASEPGVAFVTETMAQLYVQQGLTQQALDVYRQLAEQRPDDEPLRDRVVELEQRLEVEQAAARSEAVTPASGSFPVGAEDEPPAGSWLQRLVRARPTILGLPAVAERETPHAAPEQEPESVAPVELGVVHAELEAAEFEAIEEQEGAEELVVPPAAEPDAHEVSAFEWAIPEPEVESRLPEPEVESRLPEPDVEPRPTQLDPDDPWIFEGDRMAAAGLTGEWDSVDGTVDRTAAAPESGPAAGAPAADEPQTLEDVLARPVSPAEEHAAGALAAATVSMQDDPEVNAQLGEAVAEDPTSLLHVLRGTPRSVSALRQGASFSFDQFFHVDEPERPAEDAGGAASGTGEERPAARQERGASEEGAESDLSDFHAWLSGLNKS